MLTLFSCQAIGGDTDDALPAATAIELFHDFTLIHDDIMDQDELRRGLTTLHVKYDEGTAILVGDLLIGLAYQQLMKSTSPQIDKIINIFTEALVKVCEGQALDKEFETRTDVSVDEYLDMISKKTGWLIKVACSIGGLSGNAAPEQVELLTSFGDNLGLGFQIQDDLLDFIADESKLGKKVGSDFRMDKKTHVTLKYRELLQADATLQSRYPMNIPEFNSFSDFQSALYEIGVVESVRKEADFYIQNALSALEKISPLDENNYLYQITQFLQSRQY